MEVAPKRVVFLDQPDFPVAAPALELLLEMDGFSDLAEAPEADEAIDAVSLGEAGNLLG